MKNPKACKRKHMRCVFTECRLKNKTKQTRDQIHNALLERLVVAQEKQTVIYERMEKEIEPLMKVVKDGMKRMPKFLN